MTTLRHYKNTVWTDHALQRVQQRGITQEMVWDAVNAAETHRSGKTRYSTEFRKHFDGRTLSVVAQPKQGKEWRILSCWLNPPLEGTSDWKEYQKYHQYRDAYDKAGFWGKFWVVLKRQLGL